MVAGNYQETTRKTTKSKVRSELFNNDRLLAHSLIHQRKQKRLYCTNCTNYDEHPESPNQHSSYDFGTYRVWGPKQEAEQRGHRRQQESKSRKKNKKKITELFFFKKTTKQAEPIETNKKIETFGTTLHRFTPVLGRYTPVLGRYTPILGRYT